MTRVLLVTGSRSLATHPGAEAWARGLIRTALADVDVLIVGDASGPDRWAVQEGDDAVAHETRVYWTRGRDAGCILVPTGEGEAGYGGRWAPRGVSTHPLQRNAAMVRAAAAMAAQGYDVRVLALLDGLKGKGATRGTEHTAGLAERAGIKVQREVWHG